MILAISQYIESLTSPDGRFRTLQRIYPVSDDGSGPRFSMPGHGLVDFEVVSGGERFVLRCPLMWDADAVRRLRALAEKDRGLQCRFYTEWRVLPAEVVLFGDDGRAVEVDVLVRPAPVGEPLVGFLERAVLAGDADALETVRRSFEELAAWAARVGRGGIAPHRLIVGPGGAVRLTGFSAGDRTGPVRDMLQAAAVSAAGQEPAASAGAAENIRVALSSACEEVVWDDYWGVAAVMTDGRWSLVDGGGTTLTHDTYDWLGECSEGFFLAQKEGMCGFVDTTGREVIPFVFDDASSFSEGCALVSARGESFLVDPRGARINP